jgi:primase-polymerase (primpol)-like protein
MTTEARTGYPTIAPIERDNIPSVLKDIDRWVVWRAGPLKPNGKFDKIPCSPSNGQNIDGQDPANWLSYGAAVAAYDRDVGNGIGIVLSANHPVHFNGEAHYLIALDFDNCAQSIDTLKELWLRLGKPYAEVSPSGSGLRMFALSKEPLKGGNDGNGHELYGGGRFMTVTGKGGAVKSETPRLV